MRSTSSWHCNAIELLVRRGPANAHMLLKRADDALYRVKLAGRDSVLSASTDSAV